MTTRVPREQAAASVLTALVDTWRAEIVVLTAHGAAASAVTLQRVSTRLRASSTGRMRSSTPPRWSPRRHGDRPGASESGPRPQTRGSAFARQSRRWDGRKTTCTGPRPPAVVGYGSPTAASMADSYFSPANCGTGSPKMKLLSPRVRPCPALPARRPITGGDVGQREGTSQPLDEGPHRCQDAGPNRLLRSSAAATATVVGHGSGAGEKASPLPSQTGVQRVPSLIGASPSLSVRPSAGWPAQSQVFACPRCLIGSNETNCRP